MNRLTSLKRLVSDFVKLSKTISEIRIMTKRCSKNRKRLAEKSLRRLKKRQSLIARKMANLVLEKPNWKHLETSVSGSGNFVHFQYRSCKCPKENKGHDVVNLLQGIICYRRPPCGTHGKHNICYIPLDPIENLYTNSQFIPQPAAV